MTATVALVIVSFVAAIAVLAAVIFFADMMRADEACDAARAERDAALRDKAAQWEESQRQIAKLREEWDSLYARMRSTESACTQATIAEMRAKDELALLRPIADAAEALASGPNSPGEWAALREAIRARKEAQS